MKRFIAAEGLPFIGLSAAFFIISLVIGSFLLIVPLAVLTLFIIWFFRDPSRRVPLGEGLVVSPADGKIIAISRMDDLTKISIFMSVFNVHVNRVPVDGVVKKIEYNKGKFLVASKDKASLDNEQNAITITDDKGSDVKFVQIAGLVARRIVCYLREGASVKRGERFGMIRFGSRVDVYLPGVYKIKVALGERTKAGETILAVYG